MIVLSVREDESDKVEALDLGADDYLTNRSGSTSSSRASARCSAGPTTASAQVAPRFQLDGSNRPRGAARRRDGELVRLTKTEWALLEAFAGHPGKLLTHGWLLSHVWGEGYEDDVDVLRVFVSQLRKKIEPDPTRPRSSSPSRAWDIAGCSARLASRDGRGLG